MERMFSLAKKMAYLYPVAKTVGSFGLFLSAFALVDANREVELSDEDKSQFQQSNSRHLGEALGRLHFKAFSGTLTFDNVKAIRYRSAELLFLYNRAERKKEEFQGDEVFKGKSDSELEALVASEFQNFAQRMCRRSMIRNGHLIQWFKAVILDEFLTYYALPIAGFYAFRSY
jgi:hypothetical protein